MSIYDPPSDPLYCAHECRHCDQSMERERFGQEWICVNPECPESPKYDDTVYCTDCMKQEAYANGLCADCLTSAGFADDFHHSQYMEPDNGTNP